MKDLEQLIEDVHLAGRGRMEEECASVPRRLSRPANASHHLWRYAAAVAAVVAVAAAAVLLSPSHPQQPSPVAARGGLPLSVGQQPGSEYACSESSDGVRVYCDNACNADEVLARMDMVIKTLK